MTLEIHSVPYQAQFLAEVSRLSERLHRISPDRGGAPSLRYKLLLLRCLRNNYFITPFF